MLFGLSLSLSKKKQKKNVFLNKYTVNNWDLVHCCRSDFYYFKNLGESSKSARLVTAKSEQDPIMHISLKFEINSLNYIAVGFGSSLQQNFLIKNF